MKVIPISDVAWAMLCAASPDAGLLQRPEWRGVQGEELLRYGVVDDKEVPVAGFQLVRSKRSGLTLWSHPPFHQNCAFIAKARAKNPAKRVGEGKKLHAAIAAFLNELPGVVTVAFPPEVVDMQPYIWAGCKVVPSYTYRIELAPGIEAVRSDYAAETRNAIRKAEADGVVVRSASRSEVLPLIQATFDRKAKALDKARVDRILQAFLDSGQGYAFLTEWKGAAIAAAFCAVDAQRAYYLLGGHEKTGGHAGAGAMTVDRCIAEAVLRSIPQFDLEGSMLPDIERFFRGFGATLTPYYTVNRAPFLVEVALKRRWRHQF
ncbi:MAG: GNAT family N-acetyltransferase [Flavobacteriales bacterium]|nr:GNAT family N-acetyltransferase [Flavobacteriales bacterium]MBL0035730.1 GNAT family N-acetyltransferase [Flavobacteriales bacterium]